MASICKLPPNSSPIKGNDTTAVATPGPFAIPVEVPRKSFPTAIIVGVKKAGTRALLEFLRLNPNIRAPGPEVHFFDKNYHKGLEWYRSHIWLFASRGMVSRSLLAWRLITLCVPGGAIIIPKMLGLIEGHCSASSWLLANHSINKPHKHVNIRATKNIRMDYRNALTVPVLRHDTSRDSSSTWAKPPSDYQR
ncbi:hypothetical protein OSTOST_08734 [Ostertagia ostertagi]